MMIFSLSLSSNWLQHKQHADWRTGRNIRVVFDSDPFAPLCEYMSLFRKPEVHNIWQCRQRRTE